MKRILASLLGVLLFWEGQTAFALPSCAETLGVTFVPAQRGKLCAVFGSAVTQSLIPNASNTYDLGSASFPWRTLYTGTSRIALTSDILRVRQDAQRLFTWDASSDTAFTQTFGDAGTTAAQALTVSASTADADDDSTLTLAGGGSAAVSRGAFFRASGNEATGTGSITIQGADVTGGNINISTENSTADIILATAAAARWTLNEAGNWIAAGTGPQVLGTSTTGKLTLAGGASASVASGAFINLAGNTNASTGSVDIQAGNASGATINILTEASNGQIILGTNATGWLTLKSTGELSSTSTADFNLSGAGSTLAVEEATAGAKCMGTVTANGTTAVPVATTCALTSSRILVSRTSVIAAGVTEPGCWATNIVNATSFDLDCNDAGEDSTFNWFILHEAS